MAAKQKQSTMDALVTYMKKHPDAVYADARESLAKGGHTIFPIMWGRAQVLLGRVKAKKRGSAKAAAGAQPARAAKATKKQGKRPGRKPAATRSTGRSGGGSSGGDISIDGADLARWQQLVDHLNGGGKVALQYDGSGWVLTTS